jgi:hypothetical protein
MSGNNYTIPSSTAAPQLLTRLFLLDIVNASTPACNKYIRTDGPFGSYGHNDIVAAFNGADANNDWSANAPSGSWVTGPFDIDLSTPNHTYRNQGTLIAMRLAQSAAEFANSSSAITAGDSSAAQIFYSLHTWPSSPNPIKYAWFNVNCDGPDPVAYNLALILNGVTTNIDPDIKNDGPPH